MKCPCFPFWERKRNRPRSPGEGGRKRRASFNFGASAKDHGGSQCFGGEAGNIGVPAFQAATQRDDSPHVSAESSSASSSGPPEPAKEEGPRDQAVNGPAIPSEDGTDYAVPFTKAGSFEDGDGSEDLSDDWLELDTFDVEIRTQSQQFTVLIRNPLMKNGF